MADAPKTYRDLLVELTKDLTLPEGCDAWGIRAVHPDLRSSRGFRWPFPGNTATAPGPIIESNTDGCPDDEGDGICLAHSWRGMASGGISAATLLLCAYASTHALGCTEDEQKIRVRECVVVELIDGARLLREDGSSADLRSADLRSANLSYADLRSADLRYADLRSANLRSADLRYADLRYANLRYANLRYADLRYADLRYEVRANEYTICPTGYLVENGLLVRSAAKVSAS